MSQKLITFAKSFINGDLSAENFADPYIEMWRTERNNNLLTIDGRDVDEASSTIFCLADCFNPESDREEYEFDEIQLRKEVESTLEKLHLI